jgi:hypothetical protein
VDANHQKQQIAHTAVVPMLPKNSEASMSSTASNAPATVKLENARYASKKRRGMSFLSAWQQLPPPDGVSRPGPV